ncbi:MAG: RNA-binding S4 domain-containing protein [Eubacteriales bacterium]|nr:RNA-binding S4 domain-containing protein [Clostridiales bacterium]HCH67921.1 RNA-binding protein [Clostridiales bacterium]
MRIDKFLKVSRIIKRRTVANDACDAQHISVNGRPVKASYEVKVGDEVTVSFGQKKLVFLVKDVKEHVLKDGAAELYEVISQE